VAQEIAVCIGADGQVSSLSEGSAIVIYQKKQGTWQAGREAEFSLDKQGGIVGLRRQMATVIEFLAECKIFVGHSVVGVPYFELEKMQCSIWEFEGPPLSFLDYVLAQEEDKLAKSQEPVTPLIPFPTERAPGDYYISIKEVQENGGGITSKQVLMPVLRKVPFETLEVLCNHIPPWLEVDLKEGKMASRIEKRSATETHIYINKRGSEK